MTAGRRRRVMELRDVYFYTAGVWSVIIAYGAGRWWGGR